MKPNHKIIFFTSFFILSLLFTSFLVAGTKVKVLTKVDGVDREYFIHIPINYDSSKAVPLVFMLHGTSGDGEVFYNSYGWTELSDKQGFLAVFPSSGRYKINDNGELKTTTKWNTLPDADWSLQAGEKGLDDIKFLRKVIDEMKSKFVIDAKRIYLNGFSNGGQMAAKCAIEMSDVLAAVCSNAGSFFLDTVYKPKRIIPYLFEVGNMDYGPENVGPEVPLAYFDSLISNPGIPYQNGKHYKIDNNCIRNFNLKREHTIVGDTAFVMVATHGPNKPGPGSGYEFKFIFVKGLAHIYPNGRNHPYDAVTNHWNWMKQYVLEDSTPKKVGTKVRVVTKIDEVNREYLIHIPMNYDSSKTVPLVFMLHGTSGDGDEFYNLYGWKELADKEGFLAVFPSSGRYKINEDGELKTTTKWNTLPDANWTLQAGEKGLNDIKFLRKVIDEMKSRFKIDNKRIYLNGFSNGGQMAAKCAIEMSDVLAAVCSNAGSFYKDTVYTPKRKIPYLYEVGNKDYGPENEGPEAPLSYFDELISTPGLAYKNGHHYLVDNRCIQNFNLKREFTLVGDTNFVMVATHLPNRPGPGTGYEFKFVFVKGLAHIYPNGKQHPYDGVTNHWNWMKQYILEDSTSKALHTLITFNGYGQGQYEKGDTIHIWAKQQDGKVFTNWSGDIQYLESPNEYHSRVFMPAKNITVTANYATLTAAMEMTIVNIKGAQRNKKTYVYIPADKNKIKGVVWFFHGTNGNPASMIADPDARQMMNLLMVRDYAVVAYYSEESEYDLDFNNDGEYRYTYGVDSNLLDIANVRAIRDTFIRRNLINRNTIHAAIGWSAGGAFTEFIANSLGWKAAINHTSSGNATLSLSPKANVPYMVSINENDINSGVGPLGNQEARVNIQNYKNRGACAILHEQKRAPLFPERFDRSALISEQQSRAIFEEIKINGGLDPKNYINGFSNDLKAALLTNPGRYPVILGLLVPQREAVQKQIEVTNAEHSLKADINALSLKLIEQGCAVSTPAKDELNAKLNNFKLFPNPTSYHISMPNVKRWKIYNTAGQLLMEGKSDKVNVSSFAGGIYYVISDKGNGKFVKE